MRKRTLIIILSIAIIAVIAIGIWLWSFTQQIERVMIGYVAIARLSGTISYSKTGIFGGATITPSDVKYYVDRVVSDPAAKAVVFVIDSPGGSAAASEEIYQLIKKLAEDRVVVIYAPEVLASGGYYISLPAKRIVASPHALVGSIGSVMMLINIDEMLNKIGINVTIIKSGEYKDIGSEFRAPTEEELEILREIVNKTANIFIDRVKECRPFISSDAFTAKVYIGVDAVGVGLIDDVGTLDKATKLAKELAGIPDYAPIIEIEKPKGLLDLIFGGSTQLSDINVLNNVIPIEFANKLLYLWIPGRG